MTFFVFCIEILIACHLDDKMIRTSNISLFFKGVKFNETSELTVTKQELEFNTSTVSYFSTLSYLSTKTIRPSFQK